MKSSTKEIGTIELDEITHNAKPVTELGKNLLWVLTQAVIDNISVHTITKKYYLSPLMNEMFLLQKSNLGMFMFYSFAAAARSIAPIFVWIAVG